MYRVPHRLYGWWRGLDGHARVQASLVFLIGLVGLAHYLLFCIPQQFFIEDSAISFAYARNLVDGYGLVTYPGGERVEGYSNPSWTFLVALFYAMGVPVWTSSKVMGAVFGFLTLPMVYGTARRALRGRPDLTLQTETERARGRRHDRLALIAPLLLVISPQFAIWNASGLENSIFCFLLSSATFRIVKEGQEPECRPFSALLFALLTMTRPEGIVYAAIGLLAILVGGLERRDWKRPLIWLGTLLVPWVLYQTWRYNYFAWTWPNTYYAKLGEEKFFPFGWPGGEHRGVEIHGWRYAINYFKAHHIPYFFPFIALGLSGWRLWGWKRSAPENAELERWGTIGRGLALLGGLCLLATCAQPWEQGGQVLDHLFGTSTNDNGQEQVLGYSSPRGIIGLLMAAGMVLYSMLGSRRWTSCLAFFGLVWACLSVGHFSHAAAELTGNDELVAGVGPWNFALGSWWVLLVSGGWAGWRTSVSSFVLLLVAAVLLLDAPVDGQGLLGSMGWLSVEETQDWLDIRIWTILFAVVVLGLLTLTFRGWRSRSVLWASTVFGTFFAIYSGGDWMAQHRWFNLVSVSLMPLIAIGIASALDALPLVRRNWSLGLIPPMRRFRRISRVGFSPALVLVLGGFAFYGYSEIRTHSEPFARNPEVGVRDVNRRVRYMSWVQRRLDVDDITLLDVDMGAHVFFSGWDIVDIAGLVDVPMARHSDFNWDFVSEYIFDERRPDFAHVHSSWANRSRIDDHPEWSERYLLLPGYPIGRGACRNSGYAGQTCVRLHGGNHLAKRLFVDMESELPDTAIRFGEDVHLAQLDVPSPEIAPGGRLFIDSSWHRPSTGRSDTGEQGFRIIATLDDGGEYRASAALPPGYDWYPPGWEEDEIVHGRYRMHVPRGLPHGEYGLSIAILDQETGEVLPVEDGYASEQSLSIAGAWDTGVTVTVMSSDDAHSLAREDLRLAMDTIRAGECEAGWQQWKNAERHVMMREDWRERQRERVREEMASCWIARASASTERDEMVTALETARDWDPGHSDLDDATTGLADELEQEGDAAWQMEDAETAYVRWSDTLRLDPSRSWVRRSAEEARDARLCISRPGERGAPEVSALSVELSAPGGGELEDGQKLGGISHLHLWEADVNAELLCQLSRAVRQNEYSSEERAELSDFESVQLIHEYLSEMGSIQELDDLVRATDRLTIGGRPVGWQLIEPLVDGTPGGVEIFWKQASTRLGFVIRDSQERDVDEWQSLLRESVDEVIDSIGTLYKFDIVEGPGIDGARASFSQEGRLRYEGPRDMTELEDEIVVEVSYRGERRPTVTLRIPISSALDSEHPVNSEDQPTAMGCSARSAERPGSFLWPLAALLVVVRRRRSGLRAL